VAGVHRLRETIMRSQGPWLRVALCCLAVWLAACAESSPNNRPLKTGEVPTGAGSTAAARRFLQGTWTLVSLDVFPPNQPMIHAGATGTLTYDEFANMDVNLRLDADTARLFDRIGIPVTNGVVRTSGRTLVDMTSRTLAYTLEGQQAVRPPTHPLDTNRPRYWEVNGDMLTLTTKDQAGMALSVAVWRKN
jgi:hypothetical protein